MYPPNKKREALDLWFATYGEFSIAEFTAQLGYPNSGTMSRWIKADPRHDPDRAQYRSKPIVPKLEAIRRVADGESISAAARAVGLSRAQVRVSVNMYAEGGTAALLPKATVRRTAGMAKKKKTAPGKAPYETPPQVPAELPDDPDELKAIIGRLEFDNAVLREVLAVLKADPAFTPGSLARDEKAKAARRRRKGCQRNRGRFRFRDWSGWTSEAFVGLIDAMMSWWSSGRLKGFRDDGSLRYDTIDGRRMRLGLAA